MNRDHKSYQPQSFPIIAWLLALGLILMLLTGCAERQERRIRELQKRIANLTSETVAMKIRVDEYQDDQIRVDLRFVNRAGDVVGEVYGIVLHGEELIVEYVMIPLGNGSSEGPPQYLALPYRVYTDAIPPVEGHLVLPLYFDPHEDTAPRIFRDGTEPLGENHLREVRRLVEPVLDDAESTGGIIFVNERRPAGAWRFREGQVYRVVSRVTGAIEILEEM